jgi:hypothetical protein
VKIFDVFHRECFKLEDIKNYTKIDFESLNKLFKPIDLPNLDKTHFIQFTTNSSYQIDLDICYSNKLISKAYYDTQFLGIYVQRTLSWKIHMEQITHKISAACHPLRSFKPFMSQETLKIVDYACYEIWINILGELFTCSEIFETQKNIIRILTGCRSRDTYRDLFKSLPLQSQYIVSLLFSWHINIEQPPMKYQQFK